MRFSREVLVIDHLCLAGVLETSSPALRHGGLLQLYGEGAPFQLPPIR